MHLIHHWNFWKNRYTVTDIRNKNLGRICALKLINQGSASSSTWILK